MGEERKVYYFTRHEPTPIGGGGNHRSYQILHELRALYGEDKVIYKHVPSRRSPRSQEKRGERDGKKLRELAWRLKFLAKFFQYKGNPYKVAGYALSEEIVLPFTTLPTGSLEDLIAANGKPKLVFLDFFSLGNLIQKSREYGAPVIICPQNLESFDSNLSPHQDQWKSYQLIADFVNELRVLAECDLRVFISKIETSLISGMGLPSHYYPYLPVGEIRERLDAIRARRAKGKVEPGLFLMLGSGSHTSTADSFRWFLEKAVEEGLPNDVRVIVAGRDVDSALKLGVGAPNVEIRGWIAQEELDQLLTKVCAILAPQHLGFGALTRLAEFSCAGIPVIASAHTSWALDAPPGIAFVSNNWQEWREKLGEFRQNALVAGEHSYEQWEARQPRTLGELVAAFD